MHTAAYRGVYRPLRFRIFLINRKKNPGFSFRRIPDFGTTFPDMRYEILISPPPPNILTNFNKYFAAILSNNS